MRSNENISQSYAFFQEMIDSCYPLTFWEFDHDLKLVEKPEGDKALLFALLNGSGTYAHLRAAAQNPGDLPMILSTVHSMIWVITPGSADVENRHYYGFGPVFVNDINRSLFKKSEVYNRQSFSARYALNRIVDEIPSLPSISLFSYAIMLHKCITGNTISVNDLRHINSPADAEQKGDSSDAVSYNTQDEEESTTHAGIYEVEQKLLNAVRNGSMDYHKALARGSIMSEGVRMDSEDSVRSAKDSVILFVGLVSRAAMDGGLPSNIAYDLCDLYINMIENSTTLSEAMEVSHTMIDDYVKRVHSYHEKSTLSRPVQTCCDYIRMHVHDEITLKSLAAMTGYTEYYLSRKFKKEVGMSPADFINQARISYARLLLRSSSQSIQEISDSLNYCSANYFTNIFTKLTGMSPTAYRNSKGSD